MTNDHGWMNKRGALSVAMFFFVALGAAWAMGWLDGGNYSDDPEVAALERQRDEEFADADSMSGEQLRSVGEALKKQAAGLSSEQKMQLWKSSMPVIMPILMKQGEARLDKFLALSPQEQRREMDKKIDQQLAREQQKGSQNAKPPGSGKPQMSPAKIDELKKKFNDWTTPEQRAKFEAVMGMYNERREERGLDPVGPGQWR